MDAVSCRRTNIALDYTEKMKGQIAWNKGLTKEDPRVNSYSSKLKGRKVTPETIKKWNTKERAIKISNALKGRKFSDETKEKMSSIKKIQYLDKSNPFFGKHHTEETKNKIGQCNSKNYIEKFGKIKAEIIRKKVARKLEKNGRWLGGKSFEPYSKEFNENFRELIRQRDSLSCMKCGLFQNDCLKLYKRKLTVHHINYDKSCSIKENCCSLCTRCNFEVNINRQHWIKFFQSLLSERYGYKYSEDGKIIFQLNSNQEVTP